MGFIFYLPKRELRAPAKPNSTQQPCRRLILAKKPKRLSKTDQFVFDLDQGSAHIGLPQG